MALPGVQLADLTVVSSHIHALSQCRRAIGELGLRTEVHADTAGAAKELVDTGDRRRGVIASSLAAKTYGLEILRSDIEDAEHNTTRFLIMAREPARLALDEAEHFVTSFLFRVRNIPAALYKALGGFATNGVNMTKLESYVEDRFRVAQFYADIEGHPQARPVQLALEELAFFATEIRIFGVYRASPFRHQQLVDSDD
jgi:prephenate dehydratase